MKSASSLHGMHQYRDYSGMNITSLLGDVLPFQKRMRENCKTIGVLLISVQHLSEVTSICVTNLPQPRFVKKHARSRELQAVWTSHTTEEEIFLIGLNMISQW